VIQKGRVISDRQLKARGWVSSLADAASEFVRTRQFFYRYQK